MRTLAYPPGAAEGHHRVDWYAFQPPFCRVAEIAAAAAAHRPEQLLILVLRRGDDPPVRKDHLHFRHPIAAHTDMGTVQCQADRNSTRLNSSHTDISRMPSS